MTDQPFGKNKENKFPTLLVGKITFHGTNVGKNNANKFVTLIVGKIISKGTVF